MSRVEVRRFIHRCDFCNAETTKEDAHGWRPYGWRKIVVNGQPYDVCSICYPKEKHRDDAESGR